LIGGFQTLLAASIKLMFDEFKTFRFFTQVLLRISGGQGQQKPGRMPKGGPVLLQLHGK